MLVTRTCDEERVDVFYGGELFLNNDFFWWNQRLKGYGVFPPPWTTLAKQCQKKRPKEDGVDYPCPSGKRPRVLDQ